MSLVHHDQVPVDGGEPVLEVLAAGKVVQPGDQAAALVEGVAGPAGLDEVARQNVELEDWSAS